MHPIDRVFDYFRSIGIAGRENDLVVTDKLKLVPKPKNTLQNLLMVLDCMWGSHVGNSDTLVVLERLKIHLEVYPKESALYKRTLFVFGVLKSIALNLDPDLKILARVNFMRHLYGQEVDVPRGSLEECTKAFEQLHLEGASYWQTHLAGDVLSRIYAQLSLLDFLHASSSCRRWSRIASKYRSLEQILKAQHLPYLSSLIRSEKGVEVDFRQNRRFVALLQKAKKFENRHVKNIAYLQNARSQFESFGSVTEAILFDSSGLYLYKEGRLSPISDIFKLLPNQYEFQFRVVNNLDKIYCCRVAWVAGGDHTLEIFEVDQTSRTCTYLYRCKRNFYIDHMSYHNEKLYLNCRHQSNNLLIFDLREKKATYTTHPHMAKWNGVEEPFLFYRYALYFHVDRDYIEIVDCIDCAKEPIVISNTGSYLFVTGTCDVVYLWDARAKAILAYDPATGALLERYEGIDFTPIPFSWREGHVSNGLLYLALRNDQYHVVDLLTKKHVGNIDAGESRWTRVISNRLVGAFSRDRMDFFHRQIREIVPVSRP